MKHIKPSWLMCDALITTLLYLNEHPQSIDELTSNTDLTPARASWHLNILRDWHFTSSIRDEHHLTPEGERLSNDLRRLLRHQLDDTLSAAELIVLCCCPAEATTPNQLTRTARAHFADPDAIRNMKRATADLCDTEVLEPCSMPDKIRTMYRRTPRGQRVLGEVIERWQLIERHLPFRTGALLSNPDALLNGTLGRKDGH